MKTKAANFTAINITFENSANRNGHQAVALSIASDRSAVYNCIVRSFQVSLRCTRHTSCHLQLQYCNLPIQVPKKSTDRGCHGNEVTRAYHGLTAPGGHFGFTKVCQDRWVLYLQVPIDVGCGCFLGPQDSLYAVTGRQYYRNCHIVGTVDFIFGNSPAVFDMCTMELRENIFAPIDTVTASGRKDPDDPGGFVLQRCTIKAYQQERLKVVGYLGRDWGSLARVVVANTEITQVSTPACRVPSCSCALAAVLFRQPTRIPQVRCKWPGHHCRISFMRIDCACCCCSLGCANCRPSVSRDGFPGTPSL